MDARPLIVFDGDDTLWFVEPLYDEARTNAAAIVAEAGLDADVWDVEQRRIDLHNVRTMGVSRERFPLSCVMAYEKVAKAAGRQIDPVICECVWSAADGVFTAVAPVADGVPEVLRSLSEDYCLQLMTKGDPEVQQRRVDDAGVRRYFDAIHVVAEKDVSRFRALLDRWGGDPSHAWSVGNSIASDINPALAAGMRAIWIDAHVWPHERREHPPEAIGESDMIFRAETLRDVPMIVRSRERIPR